MQTIKRFFTNPLMRFSLKRRMSKISTLVLLLVLVGGVGGILSLFFGIDYIMSDYGADMAEMGLSMFCVIAAIHAIGVIFYSCGSASGEITGERQRQTMDLLLCSQMSPAQIVLGKLASSFSSTFIFSIAMLPVYAVTYVFGGVDPLLVLVVFALILFFSFVMSSVSIFFSSCVKKSGLASFLTILIFMALTLGNGLVELIAEAISESIEYINPQAYTYADTYTTIPWILTANPAVFTMAVISAALGDAFDGMFSFTITGNDLWEWILTFTITPVVSILMSVFSIIGATRKIDPYHQGRKKS